MKNIALLVTISLLFLSCLEERKEISFLDDFYKTPYVISEKNKQYKSYCDSLDLKEKIFYDSLENLGYKRYSIPYDNFSSPPPLPYYTEKFGSGYGGVNIIFYNGAIFLHTKSIAS